MSIKNINFVSDFCLIASSLLWTTCVGSFTAGMTLGFCNGWSLLAIGLIASCGLTISAGAATGFIALRGYDISWKDFVARERITYLFKQRGNSDL